MGNVKCVNLHTLGWSIQNRENYRCFREALVQSILLRGEIVVDHHIKCAGYATYSFMIFLSALSCFRSLRASLISHMVRGPYFCSM